MRCTETYMKMEKANMPVTVPLKQHEKAGIAAAVVATGEFMSKLGKYDLALYSKDEFEQLLTIAFRATTDTIAGLMYQDVMKQEGMIQSGDVPF